MDPLPATNGALAPLTIDAFTMADGSGVLLKIDGDEAGPLRVVVDLSSTRRLMYRLAVAHVEALRLAHEAGADAAVEAALSAVSWGAGRDAEDPAA